MIHPQKVTWNLKIPAWESRNIYKPPSLGLDVCFQGCTSSYCFWRWSWIWRRVWSYFAKFRMRGVGVTESFSLLNPKSWSFGWDDIFRLQFQVILIGEPAVNFPGCTVSIPHLPPWTHSDVYAGFSTESRGQCRKPCEGLAVADVRDPQQKGRKKGGKEAMLPCFFFGWTDFNLWINFFDISSYFFQAS